MLLCLTFIPVSSLFGGGFNLAGVGAKALSMSGSFRGIADDWSAMYWNPAGLAGQNSGAVLEAKSLFPLAWVTPYSVPTVDGYEGYELYRSGLEQSSLEAAYPSGALAFQYQVNENATAGISVFAPSALGSEWENLFLGPYEGYGENPEYPEVGWSSDMKVIDIHPTIGYAINEKLKVGLGVALKYAAIELQSPKVIPSNDGTGKRLPMPAQNFFVDAILKGDGIGFGFNIGLLYRLCEKIQVGLCYNGPTTIPIEGEVEQILYKPRMAGGGTVEVKPDAEADFPLPMDLGLGVSYKINNRLIVAADIVWTNWEALDVIDIKLNGDGLDGNPAEDTELELYWEDTYRYNVGLNYVVCPENGLECRLGYYFDPSPIPENTLRPTITDVADKHNISIGAAYNLKDNLVFEAYWEHLFSVERGAEDFDNDGDGMFDNVPGDWKMQVDTFGMQLTLKF